jgi:hypothetical protein
MRGILEGLNNRKWDVVCLSRRSMSVISFHDYY